MTQVVGLRRDAQSIANAPKNRGEDGPELAQALAQRVNEIEPPLT
jgi:hypothetical protein